MIIYIHPLYVYIYILPAEREVIEFLSAQQQALLGWEKKQGYKDSEQSPIARDTIETVIAGDA